MGADRKSIDNGIRRLNLVPEVVIKTILIDAFSRNGAVEAAQAATPMPKEPEATWQARAKAAQAGEV